jgi:hypothetical protein
VILRENQVRELKAGAATVRMSLICWRPLPPNDVVEEGVSSRSGTYRMAAVLDLKRGLREWKINSEVRKRSELMQKNDSKNKKRKARDSNRVNISEKANGILEQLRWRTNEWFVGRHVTKSDVANWLILNRTKGFTYAGIKSIQALHFDERKMLYALLQKSGGEVELPQEIRRIFLRISPAL